MNPLLPFFALGVIACATGCSPLTSGVDPFATGRDAREYNPATGRYEWAERERPRKASAAGTAATESQPPTADSRRYDLQKGRFEDPAAPGR